MAKKNKVQTVGYAEQRGQILNEDTNFAIQEAYKSLRTNISFSLRGKDCKRFCITSSASGEGKSVTLLNLAISIAQTGKKVLLIDADLRRPTMARMLVEKASPGLSEVLAGEATEAEAIRREVYPHLDVLFSGEIPPNPSEILGSERMQELIDANTAKYDYILVDTPPVGVVTDACIVANMLDGVLLLVRQGQSQKKQVKQAVNSLNLTGSNILGYVFNGVTPEERKYYEYY